MNRCERGELTRRSRDNECTLTADVLGVKQVVGAEGVFRSAASALCEAIEMMNYDAEIVMVNYDAEIDL